VFFALLTFGIRAAPPVIVNRGGIFMFAFLNKWAI
jgi:hypothetical protein